MPYGGLKDDGGSMEPGCGYVGVVCEKAVALLLDMEDDAGVWGVVGVCA